MVDANGMTGNGPLAVISFRVSGEGDSPLALEDVAAHNADTLLDILTEASEGVFLARDRSLTAPAIRFN